MLGSKATRKIVMTVFCLEGDAEDVKASLFSEEGECWFYDQDFSLGNIKIETLEPTDDEEPIHAGGQDDCPLVPVPSTRPDSRTTPDTPPEAPRSRGVLRDHGQQPGIGPFSL